VAQVSQIIRLGYRAESVRRIFDDFEKANDLKEMRA
jgi:hypothetical protein